jgi:hypothetical protein
MKFLITQKSLPIRAYMDTKVNKYKKEIAHKHKVNISFVEFIGAQDYGDLGTLYYFNINDPKHPDYKSTKVIKEMIIRENASDGIQAELENRRDKIKHELDYIKRIVKKLARWSGERDLETDILSAEEKIDRVVLKTDSVLDDMFDNLGTTGIRR